MKTNGYIALIALMAGFIIGLVLMRDTHVKAPIAQDPEMIWLRQQNDFLAREHTRLQGRYDRLQRIADSLQSQLARGEQQYTRLKTKRYETIHHLDSLRSHELYQFFAGFATDSTLSW